MKGEKRMAQKKNRDADFVAVSVFVYLLDRFADWFYTSLVEGFFGRIFIAYSVEQQAFENGFIKQYMTGNLKLREYTRKIRAFLSRSFEDSFFLRKFTGFVMSFKALSIRSCGNFCMSFGIYTIIIYFVKMFVPTLTAANATSLIVGIFSCILAIPLLFSKGTVVSAVGGSILTRLLFSEAFGFREENFQDNGKTSSNKANFMILLGMLCGVLTLFLDPIIIPIAIFVFITAALIFSIPEIGVLLALFMLPFFSVFDSPTIALSTVVLLTFLSYVLKLIRGKRIIRFELIDIAVIIFGIMIYFGGVISVGGQPSYQSALISCSLMIGYILVVNLMRTQKWLSRCFIALVSSATLVSMLGIAQYLFGTLNVSWLDRDYFPDIKGRVTALFENSNVLAAFLVMIFPLALSCLLRSKGNKRVLALISCASILLCVVFTWSRGAWLALIIVSLIYLLIYSKKTVRFLIPMMLALPFVAFLLPDTVVRRFTSIGDMADSSISYRVYTWKGTLNVIKEHLFSGVGYGSETFKEYYPTYSYAGMEAAEHSHSLYLQILFSLGIIGLLVFCCVILLFVQQSLENITTTSDIKNRHQISATFCAVIGALIMGAFDYIWFNYRVFFLFWILLALTSAYARADNNERKRHSISVENDSQKAFMDIV